MRSEPIPADFFTENRKSLLEQLETNSLALMQSAEPMIRNSDLHHLWRQDSSFFYFTGIDYPGCSLLLAPNVDGKADEILFIPSVDPEQEKWSGIMLTKERATEISGIKTVQNMDTFLPTLFRTQKWREYLFCEINDVFPDQPLTALHLLVSDIARRLPGLQFKKLSFLTSKLRVRKKPEEVKKIRHSLSIIDNALRSVLQKLKPGMMEYQVEAELMYHYINSGCARQGFDAICAGGKNATVLHYVENGEELQGGDLLLIDTGGEYGMYSGDITRTYPINGKFDKRQRQCYQAVLDVNQAFIEELKPNLCWKQLYEKAGEITGDIYSQNGFIEDPKKHLSVSFHRIGHYLGLDVHDVGNLDWPMEPGTIITVEPGLYLGDEGIGIRIEDNVLFTEDGIEVLSSSLPKEIEEIEALMASST